MGFEVSQSVTIAADPETVWRLLIDTSSWGTWWPDCIAAQAADFRPLREGSRVEIVLQPKHGKLTLHTVVDLVTEHKCLSMTGRGPVLQTTIAWYLQPSERGTRVTLRGAFAGLGSTWMRLFRTSDTVRFSVHGNLRGLKRFAEQMA